MAETTQESVIFSLTLNAKQFQEEQEKIRKSQAELVLGIEATKKKTAELQASYKAGGKTSAEYAQESVKLREELRAQQADQRQLTKELDTLQKAYTSAAGSVPALRAQLFETKQAFYDMSQAERESAEGQALQQKALAISDALSAIEKSVGTASRDVGKYGESLQAALTPAAGSLADLRQQLTALKSQRETLDPTTEEAEKLNSKILKLDTTIQQASGRIDEFGERVQRNIRRENFDTVTDALSGLTAGLGTTTLLFSDNETAAKAEAQALKLAALATNARAIAIGLASVPEAAQIGLLKAKSLLFKEEAVTTAAATVSTEAHAAVAGADAAAVAAQAGAAALNAEAQAGGTAATVANTVATEAQAVATGGATLASRAAAVAVRLLGLAMSLTPIGFLLVGLAALVGGLLAYSNASDRTKERVNKLVEALFRYATPVGLAVTITQRLYEKFELVRKVLDPAIAGFRVLAGWVEKNGRSALEYIGILDTQAEKMSKLAEQEFKRGEALRAQAESEIAYLRAIGIAEKQLTQERLASVKQGIEQAAERLRRFKEANKDELEGIKTRDKANEELSEKQTKLLDEVAEREKTLTDLVTKQEDIKNEAYEHDRSARAQAAADVEKDTQRATAYYRRQLEEGIANQKALLQSRISTLDRGLELVRLNSAEELELQRKRIAAQRDLELLNLGPTLAQEQAVRRKFLAQQIAEQGKREKEELAQFGLTEEQKRHIEKEYRDKAADLRLAFSTAEAQREVKARQTIAANAQAADLKLTTDYLRQQTVLSLQAEQERNNASLALNAQAQAERAAQGLQATQQQLREGYQLQGRAAILERELALASLNQRQDNAAAELRIRADALRKIAELEAAQADAARQRRARELSEQAAYYTLLADGMLAGRTQGEQQQLAATETYKQQRIAAVLDEQDARLTLVAHGSQEETNILLDAENKIKQIRADSAQAQFDLLKQQTEKIASVVTNSLSSLAAIQDADSQAKLARIDAEMNKAGVSAARHDVLEKQKLRVEQQAAEQRKKLARAQAVVQLGQAVMTILSSPAAPFVEPAASIVRGLEIAAATAAAYAQFRAIDSAKFAQGGIVQGPSHAQGGIQMWHRGGAHVGEMEGGEAIMSVGAVKRFGGLLSQLNVLGGGRPFAHLSDALSIPAKYSEGGIIPANLPEYLPQVRTGGVVVHTPPIDYDALAAALAARPADHEALADALAAKLTPAFVAGVRALPPQNINLTELRERNEQLDKWQAQLDN